MSSVNVDVFYAKPVSLVNFVICPYHFVPVISINYELSAGKFSDCFCNELILHVVLILCFVFAMLCSLFQCTVDYYSE